MLVGSSFSLLRRRGGSPAEAAAAAAALPLGPPEAGNSTPLVLCFLLLLLCRLHHGPPCIVTAAEKEKKNGRFIHSIYALQEGSCISRTFFILCTAEGGKKMLPCFYSDAEIMCNLKVVHQQLFLHEEHGAFGALENTGSKLFGTLTEVLK